MNYLKKILTLSLLFILFSKSCYGQNKILINEFLIDPQPQQVEIINTGTESTDLGGWIIDDSGGTTFYTIPQSSILYPNSCLVFSGDFNLNKTSADTIRLINNQQLIDSFSYKTSSGSGISYFRLPDSGNSWSTGSASLGKFNSTGLSCFVSPSPTEAGWINPSPTITDSPTLISLSYDNIFISEAMVNPESGESEWIELYNNNDFIVSLTNWYIDDIENFGSTPKIFTLEIPAKEYRVFNLSSSMFNNDGDSVRLLDFNKSLKDSFEYGSSIQGKTWGKIDLNNDSFCLQESSYELINSLCLNSNTSPTPTQSPIKTVIITSKPVVKPTNYNVLIHQNSISQPKNTYQGNVLGISTKKTNNNFLLIRVLSSISLSYSLLTIMAVLFKMKLLYGKGKKLFSTFIYTNRTQ
ncbi:MAG: lamin tail domain-containing protein [Candidatus Roizmanbacteria bacterium]